MSDIKRDDVFYANAVPSAVWEDSIDVSGGEKREQYEHNTRELINDGDFDIAVERGIPVYRVKITIEEQIL
jgi:hypothetical protein